MCRIAGIIDKSNPQLRQDITAMRDAMRHGGPDAEGIYLDESAGLALGHRRLSIIDLSNAGNQPMQRDHLIVCFNGEIYNFRALRDELKNAGFFFTAESDTEVIIRAYQHWGTGCFDRFRGMFAIAIYDRQKGELILARDHAGIKPLYFYCRNDKLYFASEIRGFNALKNKWQEREDWKIFFLTYGFLPEPVTTIKDVCPVDKGSFYVFDIRTLACTQQYFYEDRYAEEITSEEEAKELIRRQLAISVQRHLVADAPLGIFLSGGIDSSILTILARQYKPSDLHTLSLVFEDQQFSERVFQDIIVEKTGSIHEAILVKKKDFESSFEDIFRAMDQPSTDGINSYFICKYARKAGLKAVLSGLGADEIFGGYPSFKRSGHYRQLSKIPSVLLALAHIDPKDSHRKLSFLQRKDPIGEYLFYRGYFTPAETARLLGAALDEVSSALREIKVPGSVTKFSDGNRVSYLESNIYMQAQLLKDTDVMSMWHSVEVRVPFLDRDLLQTVQRISSSLKYDDARAKYLLIESFKELLPREIWDRKKQGFVLPFNNWMKGKHLSEELSIQKKNNRLHRRFNNGKLAWSRYWAYLLSNSFNSDNSTHPSPLLTHQPNPPVNSQISKFKILFLSLTTFSHAGGIEKFNKCFLRSIREMEEEGILSSSAMSPYDGKSDERYYPQEKYRGFNEKRFRFIYQAVKAARHFDQVVIGHLNLAPVGWMIKKLYPEKKLVLIAHGIEVWEPLKGSKKKMLDYADVILSVSNFTRSKLIALHGLPPEKIKLFPNTIDPYFPVPGQFKKISSLQAKHRIGENDPVLFTLSRLSGREKYKGYDVVIECLPELKKTFPRIKYIVGGKYDDSEKERLDELISFLGVREQVILAGYVAEDDLTEYYQAADLFIMPSRKEGFGIVFLEAMVCGLQVIGGNQDGSVDALRNGELGTLVDPSDKNEIISAISNLLGKKKDYHSDAKLVLQKKVLEHFGFEQYKKRLKDVLLGG